MDSDTDTNNDTSGSSALYEGSGIESAESESSPGESESDDEESDWHLKPETSHRFECSLLVFTYTVPTSASTSDQKDSHVSPVHDDISRLKNKNGDKTNESVSSYTASTSIRDTDTRAKPTDKLLGKPKRDVPKPNTRDTDTMFTKNDPGNKRRSSGSGSDTNNYNVVYNTTTEIRSLLTTPDTAHDTPVHEQRNRTYNNTRTYWFKENGVHW